MGVVTLLDVTLLEDPAALDRVRAALPPARLEKADRCRHEADRRRSLAAGAALDRSLARFGLRLREVTVTEDRGGKPFLPDHTDLRFNLSHSGRWAACALSDREVGVDVETLRDRSPALIRRVCTPAEEAYLLDRTPEEQRLAFARLWTAKESCMKCLGKGLALDPGKLTFDPNAPDRIALAGQEVPFHLTSWRLADAVLTVCAARPEEFTLHVLTMEDLNF